MAAPDIAIPSVYHQMLSDDPTIDLDTPADTANGSKPDPPNRYGEPLPDTWVPMYMRTMRTPTRKLRIVAIGAGFSSMNLAYRIYHHHKDLLGHFCELQLYEARDDIGGTWLVRYQPNIDGVDF